jgi:hypothetical protein
MIPSLSLGVLTLQTARSEEGKKNTERGFSYPTPDSDLSAAEQDGGIDVRSSSRNVQYRLIIMAFARRSRIPARWGEPVASANNIDHIIKSPPLMSRDAPVM